MIFHLAIPAENLDVSRAFYVKLGASVGRSYPSHVVLNFYNCQLVLHQSTEIERLPKMYPSHFGVILESYVTLSALWNFWKDEVNVFEAYFTRLKGEKAEHSTFFLLDPSNNVIEFKSYKNSDAIFG